MTDYDVVVLGAGSGGLTAAGLSAAIGASVILVDKRLPGGDCTWTGCVPSKTLLSIAFKAKATRKEELRLLRFSSLSRVRETRTRVYEKSDSPDVLARHNVLFKLGTASFVGSGKVEVDLGESVEQVTGKKFVIATGSRPTLLAISGVSKEFVITTDSFFELEKIPDRLAIVGAGPTGLEIGEACALLGSEVTIVERENEGIKNVDPEIAHVLIQRLKTLGVKFLFNAQIESGSESDRGREKALTLSCVQGNERIEEIIVDKLLVAIGRTPNVDELSLEGVGVKFGKQGIHVGQFGQTTSKSIYAIGDVTPGPKFTHRAESDARVLVKRVLLKLPAKRIKNFPWIVYTSPEIGSVGQTKAELDARTIAYATISVSSEILDRAKLGGEEEHDPFLLKLFYKQMSGKILGAQVVGQRAGELVHELNLAIERKISLRQLSKTIHAYPSWSQAIRIAGDIYVVRSTPAWMAKVIKFVFRLRGTVSSHFGSNDYP